MKNFKKRLYLVFAAMAMVALLVTAGCAIFESNVNKWNTLNSEQKLSVVNAQILSSAQLVQSLHETNIIDESEYESGKRAVEDAAKAYNVTLNLVRSGVLTPEQEAQQLEFIKSKVDAFIILLREYIVAHQNSPLTNIDSTTTE